MQVELFPPATRKTDPHSSHIAEKKMIDSGARKSQCQIVLDVLAAAEYPLTAKEIATRCYYDSVQVTRRLCDMKGKKDHNGFVVREAKVIQCAIRVCNTDGRTKMTTWSAVRNG